MNAEALAVILAVLGPNPAVDKEELTCAAQNVWHEARGGSTDDWAAVTLVVMNRAWSSRYPEAICDVVWQPHQFSWTRDGRSDDVEPGALWQRIVEAAYETLRGGVPDFTDGAVFYHTPAVSPHWAQDMTEVGVFGKHVFYREGP